MKSFFLSIYEAIVAVKAHKAKRYVNRLGS
jgi:hypothetical protein